MNLFYDLLSCDLQHYIITFNFANLIICYWKKRISRKSALISSLLHIKFKHLSIPSYDPTNIITAKLFLRASTLLSGSEDFVFWSNIINSFTYSINFYLYHYLSFSSDVLDTYHLSETSCINLAKKFNINIINYLV